jgi:hypothetical protein
MSKRSRPDGPCRTKATYDHKRPRYDPPSPDRVKAKLDQDTRDAERERNCHKLGLYEALGMDKIKV